MKKLLAILFILGHIVLCSLCMVGCAKKEESPLIIKNEVRGELVYTLPRFKEFLHLQVLLSD